MRKVLMTALALLVGVPLILFGIYWIWGSYAENTARTVDIDPSPNLLALAATYQIARSEPIRVDCDQSEYRENPGMKAWGTSIRFLSWVKDARSAESAAIQYSLRGDSKMAEVATLDAVDRWQRAWQEKSNLACYEIQGQRGSY